MLLKKIKAVSYVEVVLVLIIIGVVSSMAIPTLKKYTQKQEFAKDAQKAFYTLNEVVDNATTIQGPIRKISADKVFSDFLQPSFKKQTAGTNYTTTKDGMKFVKYTPTTADSEHIYISVDVNGSAKGPNAAGKDIQYFKIKLSDGTVLPEGDTKILYENNWTYPDELWNR